jgi:hypothetical protein
VDVREPVELEVPSILSSETRLPLPFLTSMSLAPNSTLVVQMQATGPTIRDTPGPRELRSWGGRDAEEAHPLSLTWDAVPIEERVAVIGRLNKRVDAAQQAAEPTKARVRKVIRREGAPRCPVRLRRVSYDLILRYRDALADLFVRYGICVNTFSPTYTNTGLIRRDPVLPRPARISSSTVGTASRQPRSIAVRARDCLTGRPFQCRSR